MCVPYGLCENGHHSGCNSEPPGCLADLLTWISHFLLDYTQKCFVKKNIICCLFGESVKVASNYGSFSKPG